MAGLNPVSDYTKKVVLQLFFIPQNVPFSIFFLGNIIIQPNASLLHFRDEGSIRKIGFYVISICRSIFLVIDPATFLFISCLPLFLLHTCTLAFGCFPFQFSRMFSEYSVYFLVELCYRYLKFMFSAFIIPNDAWFFHIFSTQAPFGRV